MADEGRSSRKRKRAKRRGADKTKNFANNMADSNRPSSKKDIVVSGSSDGRKFQRVSGSSSFLDKVRLLLVTNLILKSILFGNLRIS